MRSGNDWSLRRCGAVVFGNAGLIREEFDGPFMQIIVRVNNVDQALRALKKKLQREGVYREMKLRRHYEKPSERTVRKKGEAIRRARKLARKQMIREGLIAAPKKRIPGAAGEARPKTPRPAGWSLPSGRSRASPC